MRVALSAILALLAALVLPAGSLAAANDTLLTSRVGLAGEAGNNQSRDADLSANGRYVAFKADAGNLHPDGGGILVRDMQTGTNVLASRASGEDGAPAAGSSSFPSISADGRYVAFASSARNLVPGTPFCSHSFESLCNQIYVRDLQLHTTVLASRAPGVDGGLADWGASWPSISDTGRYVAFSSLSQNFGADQDYPDDEPYAVIADVFVRDLQLHTNELVSRDDGDDGAVGDQHSEIPSIAGDGQRVAFYSAASNISDDDAAGNSDPDLPGDEIQDIFVRDRTTDTTILASRADGANGVPGDVDSTQPELSADGSSVAFQSEATNLSTADADPPRDIYVPTDVFVRDLDTGDTELISRETGPNGTGADLQSSDASISTDGSAVAFQSLASNLSGEDRDTGFLGPQLDVFVRDRDAQTTLLASRASGVAGAAGDEVSSLPGLSGDGSFVAFSSSASNFGAATGGQLQVFRRDISAGAPPDADLDGRQDSLDNCPNAANQGQGDTDSDGQGDACDTDDDNDGRSDGGDNCPTVPNPGQGNADGDGAGDACEDDDDNDGLADGSDNCPTAANPGQANGDFDQLGDACDDDLDNDGVPNGTDNCPTSNPAQADSDGDGKGDACDLPGGGGGGGGGSGGGGGGGTTTRPTLAGPGKLGRVRVSRRGAASLPGLKVGCRGAGRRCRVSASVAAGKVRLGGSAFRVAPGATSKVRLTLTRKGRSLLRRRGRVKARVRIVVSRGDSVAFRTFRVTLLAP